MHGPLLTGRPHIYILGPSVIVAEGDGTDVGGIIVAGADGIGESDGMGDSDGSAEVDGAGGAG